MAEAFPENHRLQLNTVTDSATTIPMRIFFGFMPVRGSALIKLTEILQEDLSFLDGETLVSIHFVWSLTGLMKLRMRLG